jgi:hypothetical protein
VLSTGARYRASPISAVTFTRRYEVHDQENRRRQRRGFHAFLRLSMIGSKNRIFLLVDRGPTHIPALLTVRHIHRIQTRRNKCGNISKPPRSGVSITSLDDFNHKVRSSKRSHG